MFEGGRSASSRRPDRPPRCRQRSPGTYSRRTLATHRLIPLSSAGHGVRLFGGTSLTAAGSESEVTTRVLVSADSFVGDIPLSDGGAPPLHATRDLTITGRPGEPVALALAEAKAPFGPEDSLEPRLRLARDKPV